MGLSRRKFAPRISTGIAVAVGAAVVLAGCGADDAETGPNEGDNDSREVLSDDTPQDFDRTLHELSLTSDAVEGVQLTPIPDEEISQMAERDPMLTDAMRTEPAECMEVGGSPIGAETGPGDFHAQVAVVQNQQLGVFLFSDTDFVETLPALTDQCENFTIHLDGQGGADGIVSEMRNEEIDAPEPEGVDSFVSVLQNATGTVGGADIDSQSAILSGAVDGRGVQVTVQSFEGDVPQEALDSASDVFAAQVERLLDA